MPSIITPSNPEIRELVYDPEASELGPMPDDVRRVLNDVAALLDEDATITVGRDWERCIFALVDGPRSQPFVHAHRRRPAQRRTVQ